MWERLHRLVLDELPEAKLIDWSRGGVDSVESERKRGRADRPQPTDRGKLSTVYHLLVDATGLLRVSLRSGGARRS